ncbi:tyrosine-protein kinase domain-containing protein [Thalassospira profundimaris]|nr:tyrosine-protein kinase domain-containing protein [Thalassospira profundimaris]
MTQRDPQNRAGGQPVTLADMVPVIWRRRGVVLLVLALLLGLVAALVPLWQPDYQARAQIGFLPATPAPLAHSDNGAAPPAIFQISDIDTEMAVLRSTAVLSAARAVLRGEGVNFDPEPSKLAQWLGMDRAKTPVIPPGESIETVREARDIAILRGKIKTAQLDNARVIEVSLFDRNPARARQMLDAVINSYVWKRQNDLRGKLADQYDETLRQRDAAIIRQQQQQQALMDWQDAHSLAFGGFAGVAGQNGADDSKAGSLETLRQQREAARIDLAALQSRQQAVARANGDVAALMRLPEIANNDAVRELNLRLAQLRGMAADLARRYGPRHPLVQANQAQIVQAEDDLQTAISAQIAAINRDAGEAATRLASYEAEYRRIMAEMAANNRDRLAFVQLQRALEDAGREVAILSDRARLMQSQLAALRPDVEILQAPEIPGKPVFPSRRHLAVLGGAVAILLALAAAILRDYLDRALHRAQDAETLTGLPIFAVLPRMTKRDPQGRAADEENEAIGHLQTIIRLRHERRTPRMEQAPTVPTDPAATGRVICVTSPMPGDGKSRLARKIAARFARNRHRVLLLDGDLRRPTRLMDQGFASLMTKQPAQDEGDFTHASIPPSLRNLQGVLQGDCGVEDAVLRLRDRDLPGSEPVPEYDFLGAEDAVASALAGQLMAEKLGPLIVDLKTRYDFIVIDAPPVLSVADAIWLMRVADDRLLLLRAGKSHREDISDAANRLAQAGCAADGIVFSGVSRRGAYYGSKKRRKAS